MDEKQLAALALATADDDTLTGLDAVTQIRRELERVEAVLVRRARNQGVTWARIARVLGISRQAVHQKYGGRRMFGGTP